MSRPRERQQVVAAAAPPGTEAVPTVEAAPAVEKELSTKEIQDRNGSARGLTVP